MKNAFIETYCTGTTSKPDLNTYLNIKIKSKIIFGRPIKSSQDANSSLFLLWNYLGIKHRHQQFYTFTGKKLSRNLSKYSFRATIVGRIIFNKSDTDK